MKRILTLSLLTAVLAVSNSHAMIHSFFNRMCIASLAGMGTVKGGTELYNRYQTSQIEALTKNHAILTPQQIESLKEAAQKENDVRSEATRNTAELMRSATILAVFGSLITAPFAEDKSPVMNTCLKIFDTCERSSEYIKGKIPARYRSMAVSALALSSTSYLAYKAWNNTIKNKETQTK